MPNKSKKITNAELTIMSLLVEGPMYGYQIEQTIEERGMREWTSIGFSSIYYILDKLKKINWLKSSIKNGDGRGPARQIFSLTEKGADAWEKAVLYSLSHPSKNYHDFQLGLSNLHHLKREKYILALGNYHKELSQKHHELSIKLQEGKNQLPWNVLAMFDLSVAQIQTEIKWINYFIFSIKKRGMG